MRVSDIRPQHFLWEFQDGVATVTFNRPERKNSFTFESYAELRDLFWQLRRVEEVRAVVITGAGGNFCSGGDVHEIIRPLLDMDVRGKLAFTRMTGELVVAMRHSPQPLIAAVDGVCVGAGAVVASACDVRLGTARSRVAFLFRATVGAAAVGFAGRALDEAVRYTGQRVAFDRRLSDFQLVRWKLAWMATELDASRLLVYRAAWAHDQDVQRGPEDSSMAKLYATEAAQRVVDEAVQLHGAWGVVAGGVVERLYREVRALRIYEGTSEIQALVVGRQLVRGRRGQEVER